jgi:hypothetical protein
MSASWNWDAWMMAKTLLRKQNLLSARDSNWPALFLETTIVRLRAALILLRLIDELSKPTAHGACQTHLILSHRSPNSHFTLILVLPRNRTRQVFILRESPETHGRAWQMGLAIGKQIPGKGKSRLFVSVWLPQPYCHSYCPSHSPFFPVCQITKLRWEPGSWIVTCSTKTLASRKRCFSRRFDAVLQVSLPNHPARPARSSNSPIFPTIPHTSFLPSHSRLLRVNGFGWTAKV